MDEDAALKGKFADGRHDQRYDTCHEGAVARAGEGERGERGRCAEQQRRAEKFGESARGVPELPASVHVDHRRTSNREETCERGKANHYECENRLPGTRNL